MGNYLVVFHDGEEYSVGEMVVTGNSAMPGTFAWHETLGDVVKAIKAGWTPPITIYTGGDDEIAGALAYLLKDTQYTVKARNKEAL